jgi:SAM-dependent methyltransferase
MQNPIEFELDSLVDLYNYNQWIADSFYPFAKGSIMEIGAGIGTLSAYMTTVSDHLTLVEPSPVLFEKLKTKFALDENVTPIQNTIETLLDVTNGQTFDAIVMSNVLEHIKDDRAALKILSDLLRPGGYLLLFVPALQVLFSDLDRAVGHYRRYHQKDLREKAATAGFEIVKLRYFDWLGAIAWWCANVLLKQTNINPNSAKLYDRFGIPVTRAVEHIISPPFGKNLILVAKKK